MSQPDPARINSYFCWIQFPECQVLTNQDPGITLSGNKGFEYIEIERSMRLYNGASTGDFLLSLFAEFFSEND